MKLALPADLASSLVVAGARTDTLPTHARPEAKLITSWRQMAMHLRAQAQMSMQQDHDAQRAAGREPIGYIPLEAKEMLARANTYELCAIELAAALGVRAT